MSVVYSLYITFRFSKGFQMRFSDHFAKLRSLIYKLLSIIIRSSFIRSIIIKGSGSIATMSKLYIIIIH